MLFRSMIVGTIRVAHGAAIADDLVQNFADRLRNHDKSRDRQQRRCKLRHQRAQMNIAGEHNLRSAYTAVRSDDTLAHARRIERDRRRLLKNACAGFFGECRKSERIVVRVDVKSLPVMDRAEISRAGQLLPNSFRGPELDVGADPAHEQARTALAERNNALTKTLKVRETGLARAEEKIAALTERNGHLEADIQISRTNIEKRVEDLNSALQRERMERAVVEGALEAARKDNSRLQSEVAALRSTLRRGAPLDDAPVPPAEAANDEAPSKGKRVKGAEGSQG